MLSNFSEIPLLENIENISRSTIEQIKRAGIFYVKIPVKSLTEDLTICRGKALELFQSKEENKINYSKTNGKRGIFEEGYHDRRSDYEYLETFRQFSDKAPIPPFDQCANSIISLNKEIMNEVVAKILLKAFDVSGVKDNNFRQSDRNFTYHLTSIFTFNYYPIKNSLANKDEKTRFNPHKDTDVMTIIFLDKPGLEFWADGSWVSVSPKNGYAVGLFGYAAEVLSHGKIKACLHAVKMEKSEERLSIVIFFGIKPFSLLTGISIIDDYSNHLEHIKQYAEQTAREKMHINIATENIKRKISILFLLIINFFIIAKSKSFNINEILSLKRIFILAFTNFFAYNINNRIIDLFEKKYVSRLYIDYLQYPNCPEQANQKQRNAYSLGRSALSFYGLVKSISNPSLICSYTSFWNAGLMKEIIDRSDNINFKKSR